MCLGGDGVLLHVNSIFGDRLPPVVPFFLGTLGFLTGFNIENFEEVLDKVIKVISPSSVYFIAKSLQGTAVLTLRARLHCKLFRKKVDERHDENDKQTPASLFKREGK